MVGHYTLQPKGLPEERRSDLMQVALLCALLCDYPPSKPCQGTIVSSHHRFLCCPVGELQSVCDVVRSVCDIAMNRHSIAFLLLFLRCFRGFSFSSFASTPSRASTSPWYSAGCLVAGRMIFGDHEQKALAKAVALCDEELSRMGTPLAQDQAELDELKKDGGLDGSKVQLLRHKIALEYRIGVKSILSAFRENALESIGRSA